MTLTTRNLKETNHDVGIGHRIGAFAHSGPGRIWLILSFLPCVFAQRQSFKYYGQEQGLSNLATECLLQDRAGYLWVGTQNGLFRYDGAAFTAFGEADGLPGTTIDALVETPDGVLWVATSHGLARRRGARFEAVDPGTRVVGSGRFGLASDSTGRLYLSTIAGLLISNPTRAGGRRRFEPIHGQPAGPAYGVHVDRSGALWFGCGAGVCLVSGETIQVFGPRQGVPSDRWDAITTDHEGAVWIRSSTHLLRKAGAGNQFETIPDSIPHVGDFATLSLGRDGELFVPTDDGVWEFSNGRWRGIGRAQGLAAGAVSAVLQDREGSIWIGLWGAGLARWLGRNQWEGWTRAEGLSGEHVWEITRDRRGHLWVATDNGVNQMRIDPRSGRPVGEPGPNETDWPATKREPWCWVRTAPCGSGVHREESRESIRFQERSQVFVALWSGQRPDLAPPFRSHGHSLGVHARRPVLLEPRNRTDDVRKADPADGRPAGEMISATLEDRRGRLWVAGTQGLARRENGVWKRFTRPDGLPSNSAGFLGEGPDGSIRLGYRDRTGMSRIELQGDRLFVQTYNLKSGLRSDQAIFVRSTGAGGSGLGRTAASTYSGTATGVTMGSRTG